MPPQRRRIWPVVLRIAAVVLVVAGVYFFARGIDGRVLLATLRSAAPLPIAAAAAIGFVNLFFKALCWKILLRPHHRVPLFRIYRYTIAAFAASLLLPARAGEALRFWLLKRRDGVALTASGGVAISEKLVDGCAMILSVSPTLFLIDGLPDWVGRTIAFLVGGAVVGLVVALVARKLAKGDGVLGRLTRSMTAFERPATFFLALAACLGAWMVDLTMVLLVLGAVGVHVPAAVGLLILLGVNVAILIPTTPGNVGSLEIGAVAALKLVGIPEAPAMAFAILYHAVQVLPLLVAGLLDMRLVLWARRGEEAETQAAGGKLAAVADD